MFKWTNINEIEIIFIDNEIEHKAKELIKNDLIKNNFKFQVLDIPPTNELREFLYEKTSGKIPSNKIIFISNDIEKCKSFFSYRVGTIYLYNKFYLSQNAILPDVCINYSSLKEISISECIKSDMFYLAEYLSLSTNILTDEYITRCYGVKIDTIGSYNLYILGRYYSNGRYKNFFNKDLLSKRILDFKSEHNMNFYKSFNFVINGIDKQNKVDIVTYVPLKKGEENKFDRFKDLKLEINAEYKSIFKNVKPYNNKIMAVEERKENLKDSYILLDDINVKEKHIVIIDDVITTSSTIKELTNLLVLNGVKKISVIVLASNQTIDLGETINNEIKPIRCKNCKKELILNRNSKTNEPFWGCGDKKHKTLSYIDGYNEFKKINSRIFDNEENIDF